jgi:hypothetical protein
MENPLYFLASSLNDTGSDREVNVQPPSHDLAQVYYRGLSQINRGQTIALPET